MHKKDLAFPAVILALSLMLSGCIAIGALVSAGISYGIYQATKK